MGDAIRWIFTSLALIWLLAALLLILAIAYGWALSWLTRRAWEPIDALSRELDAEEQAEQDYLDWLESTWRHPSSRVPRVPRD